MPDYAKGISEVLKNTFEKGFSIGKCEGIKQELQVRDECLASVSLGFLVYYMYLIKCEV
ncbi:hypothetical protein AAHB51_29645 [Bacillus cereus]